MTSTTIDRIEWRLTLTEHMRMMNSCLDHGGVTWRFSWSGTKCNCRMWQLIIIWIRTSSSRECVKVGSVRKRCALNDVRFSHIILQTGMGLRTIVSVIHNVTTQVCRLSWASCYDCHWYLNWIMISSKSHQKLVWCKIQTSQGVKIYQL